MYNDRVILCNNMKNDQPSGSGYRGKCTCNLLSRLNGSIRQLEKNLGKVSHAGIRVSLQGISFTLHITAYICNVF